MFAADLGRAEMRAGAEADAAGEGFGVVDGPAVPFAMPAEAAFGAAGAPGTACGAAGAGVAGEASDAR